VVGECGVGVERTWTGITGPISDTWISAVDVESVWNQHACIFFGSKTKKIFSIDISAVLLETCCLVCDRRCVVSVGVFCFAQWSQEHFWLIGLSLIGQRNPFVYGQKQHVLTFIPNTSSGQTTIRVYQRDLLN